MLAIDASRSAPALFAAQGAVIERCSELSYLDSLLAFCKRESIGVVVPTIDTELSIYASAVDHFRAEDVRLCVSAWGTINICGDKSETHRWLIANGFPTVRQADPQEVLQDREGWRFPLIVKPRHGSASIGVVKVESLEQLECVVNGQRDYIVQEVALGREFTINTFVTSGGRCVCAVPHWRLAVRGGEVSKAITVRDSRLIELGKEISERLPGAYGPLNVQCFVSEDGEVKVIEINARFGGGYPLAHKAGARFTSWLLDDLCGHVVSGCDDWTDDLAMLRYDEAVYVSGAELRL